MIRRAQAEALLKLAEALEECERNGVELGVGCDGEELLHYGNNPQDEYLLDGFSGVDLRMAIAKLYPKSEAAE